MAESTVAQEFGRRLRRRRQVMGFTQRAIADAIEMAPPQYSKLEAGGIRMVQLEQFKALVSKLETSADYLLGLSEDMGHIPPDVCPLEAESVAGLAPLATPTLVVENDHHEYT